MTAKDEAQKIVNRFYLFTQSQTLADGYILQKECARYAIELIIEALLDSDDHSDIGYWELVKAEIKQL